MDEVPPRVLAAEARRRFRDLLAASSLGCSCGHLRSEHTAEDYDERGDPIRPVCTAAGCDLRCKPN